MAQRFRSNCYPIDELVERCFPSALGDSCEVSPVSGLSGESWKITHNQKTYLARYYTNSKKQLKISAGKEYRILGRLYSSGVTPKRCGYGKNWLLTEWIEGEALSPSELGRDENLQTLSHALSRLHVSQLSGFSLDLRSLMLYYWQRRDPKRDIPALCRLQRWAEHRAFPATLKIVAAHMDLHAGNVILTPQGMQFIDWEYAFDADIGLELALLFGGNGWSLSQQRTFLTYYCSTTRLNKENLSRSIEAWTPWANYLMLLWFEVRWHQTHNQLFLQWATPLRRYFGLFA